MSSCHSPSASPASLIPLPAPGVVAALLSPPPHIPSLSRDPPSVQSLPLVPENSCKTPAAWSCSRILPSSRASSSHCSQLPPRLMAPHCSPQHEEGSCCPEPPTATQEAEPALGRERKMGCTPRRPAAFLLYLHPPSLPTARLQALPCLSCRNSMGFCKQSSHRMI